MTRHASKQRSLQEITGAAEETIRSCMALARRASDPTDRTFHTASAWGAYRVWSRLAAGWVEDGDFQRMEALTNLESSPVESDADCAEGVSR